MSKRRARKPASARPAGRGRAAARPRDTGTLIVRVANALREPLDDEIDVKVTSVRTDALVRTVSRVRGDATIRIEGLIPGQPYIVKVFPTRHRPVGQFAIPQSDRETVVQLYAPIDPERVVQATFPAYEEAPLALRLVLERSLVEGIDGSGPALYGALTDMQRAGLYNLFAKMNSFGFDDERTIWTFVDRMYRIRPDRVFVDVQPALRDLVKGAVAGERFREVSGRLHTPPPGFLEAGSFKTSERYGNLQLSFFASQTAPIAFKIDADIDDAAGLGHAFQVLRNWVTEGTTHPYDIHQILLFRQEVTLPYHLA
jgi:hypothetical protein